MTDALLLSDPRFFQHRARAYHPERPERLEAARAAIERARTDSGLEFTAVGDPTNIASRIEGMTKGTPFGLLVAETTYSRITAPPADLVYVDELEVRGREKKIKLWGLEPRPALAEAPELEHAPAPEALTRTGASGP